MWYNFIDRQVKMVVLLTTILIFFYIGRYLFGCDNDEKQENDHKTKLLWFLIFHALLMMILFSFQSNTVNIKPLFKLIFRRYDQLSPTDMVEMINSKAAKTLETIVYQDYLNINDIDLIVKNHHYDINRIDNNGKTIAHFWRYIDSSLREKILSEYKPNLNIQDNDGNTPIMLLFDDHHVLFWDIDTFIKHGANVLIRNKQGFSLLELLEMKYNKDKIEETYNMDSINHGTLFQHLILSVNNHEKQNYTLFEAIFYSNLNIINK